MSRRKHFLFSNLVLVAITVTSCQVNGRLETDRVLTAAESIRDGQTEFRNSEGRYASLKELAHKQLIAKELADGEAFSYRFDLSVERDSYVLKITKINRSTPTPINGYYEQLSLYLDHTGVIRASTDPKREADSSSSKISPK
jgi:hypothetical protein